MAGIPPLKLVLTVSEVASALCVGRQAVYELMLTGKLASIKIGRARRVPIAALEAFIAERLAETEGHA
jgi:excisionase family DNA binding protein